MTTVAQDVEVIIRIDGADGTTEYWKPTQLEIARSRYNETDTARMMAVPDPDENPDAVPIEGKVVTIELGPRSSFVEDSGRETIRNEDELYRVYTGYVGNTFEMQKGLWEIDCFNFMIDLKKVEINYSTGDTETYISNIVRALVRKINDNLDETVEAELELNLDLSQQAPPPGSGYFDYYLIRNIENRDIPISTQYTGEKAADVLDDLSKRANSAWWIDANNVLQFGPTETSIHKLDWVTDTSAGKQTPPYRSVKVIGDGLVSKDGWEGKNLVSQEGVGANGNVETTNQSYGGYDERTLRNLGATTEEIELLQKTTGELRKPTFTYKNKSIKTQQEAENTRDRILDELQEQQAGGEVTVVGRPMIDPLDVIEMPDAFGNPEQDVEPAQYLVQGVRHLVDGSNGYITKVDCGGLAGRLSGPVYEHNDAGNLILSSDEGTEEGNELSGYAYLN